MTSITIFPWDILIDILEVTLAVLVLLFCLQIRKHYVAEMRGYPPSQQEDAHPRPEALPDTPAPPVKQEENRVMHDYIGSFFESSQS